METERKYIGVDFDAARAALLALSGQTAGPYFESNILLDTVNLDLLEYGSLLRLREQRWRDHVIFKLAFKGRPGPLPAKVSSSVKAREELELGIEDGGVMLAILRKLGYLETGHYEKMREAWRFQVNGMTCEADLDTLPFVQALELEADPVIINEAARLLGLDKDRISLKSYHQLHQEWRAAKNLAFSPDIIFDKAEKAHIFSVLGLSY